MKTKIKSLSIDSLVIEVTRFCPNQCAHCLRGESQNMYLSSYDFAQWISSLFERDKIGRLIISTLTFTGGEPLTPRGCDVILGILEVLKRFEVEVGGFYIATSGVNLSKKAFMTCADLYAFCADNEISQVQLSNDEFHEDCVDVDKEGLRLFQGLSFFSDKRGNDKHGGTQREYKLIAQGYAEDNFGLSEIREIEPDVFMGCVSYEVNEKGVRECEVRIVEGDLYFNAKGALIRGCDWSYESQDGRGDVTLCKNAGADFYDLLFSTVIKEIEAAGAEGAGGNEIEFNI